MHHYFFYPLEGAEAPSLNSANIGISFDGEADEVLVPKKSTMRVVVEELGAVGVGGGTEAGKKGELEIGEAAIDFFRAEVFFGGAGVVDEDRPI